MTNQALYVDMAIRAWESYTDRGTKFLDSISDEKLMNEIAPGKNRGIYLVGHLAAIHDNLFELLGFGKRLYPQLDAAFVDQPDKSPATFPTIAEVRRIWKEVHTELNKKIRATAVEDWFTRHKAVTPEDFQKEPHRNKLNVLLNRTSHNAYHLGQLVLLQEKK